MEKNYDPMKICGIVMMVYGAVSYTHLTLPTKLEV